LYFAFIYDKITEKSHNCADSIGTLIQKCIKLFQNSYTQDTPFMLNSSLQKTEDTLYALTQSKFKKNVIRQVLLFRDNLQEELFKLARDKRTEYFPFREVEVRSVIEISNLCHQACNFCGISVHSKIKPYTINYVQFIEIVAMLYSKGRRVILIQSGENRSPKYIDFVSRCVRGVRQKFRDMIIMLCLGNLSYRQYHMLKDAGADRYILKFETSNPKLYKMIKPGDTLLARIKCLEHLIKIGFEVSSGNMVGLPNQTINDLVSDLFFISRFNLTMVSTTAFIPGSSSHYYNKPMGDLNLTLNAMALMRIMYPWALIPSTSSLEKAGRDGQYLGLMAGANTVTIHDGTPEELKSCFPVYSATRFTPDERHIRDIVRRAHLLMPKGNCCISNNSTHKTKYAFVNR
jgi:biotin synthase